MIVNRGGGWVNWKGPGGRRCFGKRSIGGFGARATDEPKSHRVNRGKPWKNMGLKQLPLSHK